MTWNPDQYLFFSDHRMRPAIDLLNAIPPLEAKHVVDLGTGAGTILPALRNRWPDASLTAVDRSQEMLAKARTVFPDGSFEQADIANWEPLESPDVIFSNAALNWLDDHDKLLSPADRISEARRGIGRSDAAESRSPIPYKRVRHHRAGALCPETAPAAETGAGAQTRLLHRLFVIVQERRCGCRYLGDRLSAASERRKSGRGMDQRHISEAVPRRAYQRRTGPGSKKPTAKKFFRLIRECQTVSICLQFDGSSTLSH